MFADLKIKLLQVLESMSQVINVQSSPYIDLFESEIISKRYKNCNVQNTPFSLQFLILDRR